MKLLLMLCSSVAAVTSCTNSTIVEKESDTMQTPIEKRLRIDFEDGVPGSPPSEFVTDRTGGGHAGTWVLQAVDGAPSGRLVLAQIDTDDTDSRFPLCIYQPLRATDVRASVRFRTVRGEVDQAAGIVVRYRNKDEYYIARANALEGNVRLYKIVDGNRKQFAGTNTEVTTGTWHELGLEVQGSHFRVHYDGRLLFEADDDTLSGEGHVGLWTKADSVTWFDDLVIETLAAERRETAK